MQKLIQKLRKSNRTTKTALVVVAVIWLIALAVTGCSLISTWEQPIIAEEPATSNAEIFLNPASGPVNSTVTIYGQGWPASKQVFVYVTAPEETETTGFALSTFIVNSAGQFSGELVVPADTRWQAPGLVKVIARTGAGDISTHQLFTLTAPAQTEPTPGGVTEATPTATTVVVPGDTPTATTTSVPGLPLATTTTDLNIRSGPGVNYSIIGLLKAGQSAEVTGRSADGQWWQIKFTGVASERGWLAARYVVAQNTGNVPVVQGPAATSVPPTATPTPTSPATPVVITDWRGEYYNNQNLSGNPSVVRNDAQVNFNWGGGTPGAGLNSDSFSVRWTRNLNFAAGTYRFYVQVDDGVRLRVDGNLVIDQWHDSSPTTYTADVNLTNGTHSISVEYYEHLGDAQIQLSWDRQDISFPDWKGEYFNNPNLNGSPVLVRNDGSVNFDWRNNAPASGVPADNFSVRWTRSVNFDSGNYRFNVTVDDGVRLWVDNTLLIDQWHDSQPTGYSADIYLNSGRHEVRVEYYDRIYDAQIRLSWDRTGSSYPDWKAEYYDNRKLDNSPKLIRNDQRIDFDWGRGAPASGISADNFSVRWTRQADFDSSTYRFKVTVDDGVRVWLDNDLIIDSWQDGQSRDIRVERYVNDGEHDLRVEYYEHSGDARIKFGWEKIDQPSNRAPKANAGGPYSINEGGLVSVDGRNSTDADGSIVQYEWDFNYNSGIFDVEANGPIASYRYADGPATATIALRVTDNQGATNIATTQVTIQNVPPVAEAGGPYSGQVNNAITFAATANDPGLIDQSGLTYRWDFGDGTTGGGQIVSHVYNQSGSYPIKLTVTDKDGGWGDDTATVQVNRAPQAPQAIIHGPTEAMVGERVSFDGRSSSDPDGGLVNYAWNFGDGTTANGFQVEHVFVGAGTYKVTLTVTDSDNLSASATLNIQIKAPAPNQPPVAVINGPQNGLVGEILSFDAKRSSDPENKIVNYAWQLGDGATSREGAVSHAFDRPGKYEIVLTVTDDQGLSNTTSLVVTIAQPNTNQPPVPVINGPQIGLVGQGLKFGGWQSSDPDGKVVSHLWDFGDGATSKQGADIHVYTQPGLYTVTLTVTDDQGLTATATQLVQIGANSEPGPAPIQLERILK